jgi:YbbR domain-containing protein
MSGLEPVSNKFKSARMEIKALLRRQQWKEALIFFCFILLALGFWLLQSLQQEYEIDINIPVRYKNIPPDIAFNGTPPEKITVRVKDKGSVLLNYTFGAAFIPIDANLKTQKEQKGKLIISKKEIESDIKKQLIATTSLISFEPQSIDEEYSKRLKKEIPVVFDGTIQTEAGFKVSGDIIITPSNINVYAGNAILDTLKEIQTLFIDIKKGNKTVTRSIQLRKIKGTTFEPTIVSVTIPIEEYTEKTLEIPVICTGLPPRYTLRTFPSIVKVNCSVPLSQFKDVSADEFAVHISFEDLEQNVSGTLPIQLTKKPNWVDAATINPDKIEFILEHTNTND